MAVAGVAHLFLSRDAWAVRGGGRRTTLPYGQVRVGPGQIALGFESLSDVSPAQRWLYEQAVAAAGADPEDVLMVRITETGVEVDAIDADDEGWPVRTLRVR